MVTLKDVAQASGVGIATASIILNTPEKADRFRQETIQRVCEAARRMNYSPNHHARAFRGGLTRAIGVALESLESSDLITQPYWGRLISGMHCALQQHDNQLVLVSATHKESATRIGMRYMRERRIDALALTEMPRPEDTSLLNEPPGPYIMLGGWGELPGIPRIYTDDLRGVGLALDQLTAHGHRDILWLGPRDWYDASAERRANAFAVGCLERGLLGRMCRFSFQRHQQGQVPLLVQSRDALGEYFRSQPIPTAVLCYNGDCAVGAYRAVRAQGRTIPTDCSVIGFDSHLGPYMDPPLTTINLRRIDLGQIGANRLLEHLAEKPRETIASTYCEVLEPEVSPGESVADSPQV